jgi:hypothetical protein
MLPLQLFLEVINVLLQLPDLPILFLIHFVHRFNLYFFLRQDLPEFLNRSVLLSSLSIEPFDSSEQFYLNLSGFELVRFQHFPHLIHGRIR